MAVVLCAHELELKTEVDGFCGSMSFRDVNSHLRKTGLDSIRVLVSLRKTQSKHLQSVE